ncbi:hypothetical protein Esi_0312_0001 [Ectocarpus siliculosus]|uniref:Uncharacterized protein n=1 Tax=Ectocarpus siliculosus TaxID=2880 RepID=D7FWS0_ECTSI|nr:hypothetical protein Esi_0312_0001 [Ectocarpus siliculosus]|eukprot:CBJ32158.1 hypothetical protein Esi_0312_0001 [Ectocarpus siliculosus]
MASATMEPTSGGELVTFKPTEFVYTCNNESLAEGKRNHMKNPNAFDPAIARSFADSVVSCGAMSETTFMILSPASKTWGTTETWLSETMKALGHLPETSDERREMESRISALIQAKGPEATWDETIKATLWDYAAYGPPTNIEFNAARPEFVAVQGQHRAAVLNAAFATDLGLSLSRGGDLQGGLFTDDDCATKMPTLKGQLEKMKISVNVYSFLTHDQAEEVGRRQRTVEKTTTDVTFLDVAKSQGDLVRQVFNPNKKICRERAKEAFGPKWRHIMKNGGKRGEQKVIRRDLVNRVHEAMRKQLGLENQGKSSFAVYVYALALDPERPSLRLLRRYFNDQNAKVVKAKAAKVKSVVRASKHSAGEGSGHEDHASGTDYTPHSITVTAMGAFFSLTSYSQDTQLVQDLLMEKGLTEDFRTQCYRHFVVLEVVRAMVTGLVTRRNCLDDPHPYKDNETVIPVPAETSELFSLLKTFVSEEEGAAVAIAGKAFISSMHQEVDFWVPHLVRFSLEETDKNGPFMSGTFNVPKSALTMSLNRRTTAFTHDLSTENVNPSNKSNLTPGWGVEPFMSTSGTEPDYTPRTWDDWFTFQIRGDRGELDPKYMYRMVATVFGLLIVDRKLVGLSSGHMLAERRGKFRDLLGAIPAVGAGAKLKALLKNQKAVKAYLQVDDQSFFAEDRLALLFGDNQATGGKSVKASAERESSDEGSSADSSSDVDDSAPKRGSKEPQEKFAVSIVRDSGNNDASEVSVRWPKSVVSQLNLLDDDGELKCSDGIFRFNIEKEAT